MGEPTLVPDPAAPAPPAGPTVIVGMDREDLEVTVLALERARGAGLVSRPRVERCRELEERLLVLLAELPVEVAA